PTARVHILSSIICPTQINASPLHVVLVVTALSLCRVLERFLPILRCRAKQNYPLHFSGSPDSDMRQSNRSDCCIWSRKNSIKILYNNRTFPGSETLNC